MRALTVVQTLSLHDGEPVDWWSWEVRGDAEPSMGDEHTTGGVPAFAPRPIPNTKVGPSPSGRPVLKGAR